MRHQGIMFAPEMRRAIIDGKKTVTRRIKKDRSPLNSLKPGDLLYVKEKKLGRKVDAVAWLEVVGVSEESLQSISNEEARREGFLNAQGFKNYWEFLYEGKEAHKQWAADPVVLRIEFKKVSKEGGRDE